MRTSKARTAFPVGPLAREGSGCMELDGPAIISGGCLSVLVTRAATAPRRSPRSPPCVTVQNFWVADLENGFELREQSSQTHSWVCGECVCEVCSRNSKALKIGGTHKFLHRRHAHAPRARDTPVAARMTKTERRRPVIKVVPSSSIHPPPTLTRGPTGKAVLALEVRSRTLHGHAAWTLSGAPRRHRRLT